MITFVKLGKHGMNHIAVIDGIGVVKRNIVKCLDGEMFD